MRNNKESSEALFCGLHKLPEEKTKKLLGLLGLAARARRLVFGADLCRDEIRRGKLYLALVAKDASDNTKKRILDACKFYDADVCIVPIDTDTLSRQVGKTSSIAVVGVADENFANGIFALFEANLKDDITVPKG